jgi:hypothetical protein
MAIPKHLIVRLLAKPRRSTNRLQTGMISFSAAFACALTIFNSTQAQDYVSADCQIQSTPAFDDPTHARWYRRFWTGQCKELPFWGCQTGAPFWNAAVKDLPLRVRPERREAVAREVCELGREIGYEWARKNKKRRISTRDLQTFELLIASPGDVEAGLGDVQRRVTAKLAP